jgi:hypothetical protein
MVPEGRKAKRTPVCPTRAALAEFGILWNKVRRTDGGNKGWKIEDERRQKR